MFGRPAERIAYLFGRHLELPRGMAVADAPPEVDAINRTPHFPLMIALVDRTRI
jgi:hypothetical protein